MVALRQFSSLVLNECAPWAVNHTGFFCSSLKFKFESNGAITYFNIASNAKEAKIWSDTLGVPVFCMEQKGVLQILDVKIAAGCRDWCWVRGMVLGAEDGIGKGGACFVNSLMGRCSRLP